MKAKHITIVFGKEIKKDFSNVKTIDTEIIPNLGDELLIKEGLLKVKKKVINYKNVEDYDLDSPERGGEMIYVFV